VRTALLKNVLAMETKPFLFFWTERGEKKQRVKGRKENRKRVWGKREKEEKIDSERKKKKKRKNIT
jgi:hypothetical protein